MPLLFVLLFGSAVLGGLTYAVLRIFMRRSLPQVDGVLKMEGLSAPVEIIRDQWGVPHIYAQTMEDLLFAQGFVHAQDRLWQMEMNRRVGHGRLAELFGELAFSTDHFLRTVGFARAAQNDLQHLDAESLRTLESYARGVNAFIAQTGERSASSAPHRGGHGREPWPGARLPLEFTLLRFKPEPWKPLDSLVYGKVLAWGLSGNWDMEITNAALIGKVGPERAARLMGDYEATNPLILPEQTFAALAQDLIAHFEAAQSLLPIGQDAAHVPPRNARDWTPRAGWLGGMSNNWVVDGAKSVTGRPLLANDPHLALQMPSIWYENHLVVTGNAEGHVNSFEATGVTFPGAPFVVIGHNRDIAWGFTNAFADVQDLYVEKFNPDNPAQYEFRGQWENVQVLREPIRVKGEAAPRVVEIQTTRHGPLINHLTQVTKDSPLRLAFRWTAQDGGSILRAVERMNKASNWPEFCEAVRDWDVPSQNMVYADTAGNIAYYMPGRIPIRAKGIGLTPAPGWSGEYEWTGWIPHEELPQAFNPAQHYIATANNLVAGQEYPHFLTSATMNGFRARRIVDLLTEKEKLSADDFARIQVDLYCAPAKTFCALLAAVRPTDGYTREALVRLATWDFHLTADSVAGALFELTQHFSMKRVFGPWLGELTEHFLGVGFHPLLSAFSPYHDRSFVTLQRILVANESDWFKDGAGQPLTREQILAAALDDAIAYLRGAIGQDLNKWEWGRIHQAGFSHTLGARKPLDRIFNRGPYPYGGDPNTVWQGSFIPKLPFSTSGGSASWRQIIDVGDWDASRAVHTTGQSGQPASKHSTT